MSVNDWLRAAKAEEQRLLREIMKTDFYKQLEAVRTVIAVYQGTAGSPAATPAEPVAATVSIGANSSTSQHSFKMANAFTEAANAAGAGSIRSGPQ
jgi:hypothetical protein